MQFIKKTTLPVTKHRKQVVVQHRFKLKNDMVVEIVETNDRFNTVYASTHISEHASMEQAKAFLTKLEEVDVFEGYRINFHKVKDFTKQYLSTH